MMEIKETLTLIYKKNIAARVNWKKVIFNLTYLPTHSRKLKINHVQLLDNVVVFNFCY